MIVLTLILALIFLLSPLSVYASYDPVEPEPTFYGYKILGYDELGNVILNNADYLEYFNFKLSERAEQIESGNYIPSEPEPFSIYSLTPFDFLDGLNETKFSKSTRFIGLPDWLDFALDFAKYMLENPTMSAGQKTGTFEEKISSVGKQRIYYSNSDVYENITLGINATPKLKEAKIRVTRSGFGALSTFYLYSSETSDLWLTWNATGYEYTGFNYLYSGSENYSYLNLVVTMRSFSVNSLPVTNTSSTTVLPDNAREILGYGNIRIPYAENTFSTNSRTYNGNHQLITNNNNYWNPCTININAYPILGGTTIDQTNISQYNTYGYTWNETTNSIDFDENVLLAYIENELIPQLEIMYKNAYQDFPDIDATVGDTDIIYENPFLPETTESDSGDLPPATFPPNSGGGGLTPSELYGVLETEEYYILDLETGLPDISLNIPDAQSFPPDVISTAGTLSSFVIDLFENSGILPIFISLSILAFIVFAVHG